MTDGILLRLRLHEFLDGRSSNICVITAPSGFGKTTLLRAWAKTAPESTGAVVWVALSSEIASPHAFWEGVVASARRHGHVDAATSASLINDIQAHDDPVPRIASFLDGRGRITLVFDAYENLRDLTGTIDDDILRLTQLAPGVRVILTTRAATRLADEVLQLRGRVQTITERDLTFTPEETELLIREHAPHVDPATTRYLSRETRGYPLAIRAVAAGLARRSAAPVRDSAEWRALVTADLKSQLADPRQIEFVLATCMSPYFDADLAIALAEMDDAREILSELEWHGFGRWIPYAQGRPAFQYIDSVRDAFTVDLKATDPELYARGAAVSAEWLHRNDEHEIALNLAIDGRQFDLATRITRSLIITSPESYTSDRLEKYLRRVPRPLLPRHPMLAMALGLAYLTNPATRTAAGEYFRITAVHGTEDLREMSHAEIFFQHGIQAVSLRFIGLFQDSGAAASQAVKYYEAMSVDQHDVLAEFTPLAFRQIAYSLFQAGEVEQASSLVSRAVAATSTDWSKNYTLVYGVGIHAIDGNRPQAQATLGMVNQESWPRDHELSYMNGMGVVGRAALELDSFGHRAALQELLASESYVQTAEFWPFVTWVTMNARLGLGEASSEAHRVEEELRRNPPGIGANLGTAAVQNQLAILWLAAGRPSKAAALLEAATVCPGQLAPARILYLILSGDTDAALREVPELTGRYGHTIRSKAALFTLGAAAALRVENESTAISLLERAAALFQSYGVRAHLAYIPLSDLEELRGLAKKTGNPTLAEYLAEHVVSPLSETFETRALSRREHDVLQAFIEHRTQVRAAAALFVSTNTVKSHLQSIYRKLGVNSRERAIQRAVELDLLKPARPGVAPRRRTPDANG